MTTNRPTRHAAPTALAITTLLLAACGTPTPPRTDTPTPGAPATATITIDGGNVTAADTNGTTLRLTFPPEAIIEPVTVKLTPREPNGARARFDIEPEGLRLLLPYELHLTLPPDVALEGGRLHLDGSGIAQLPLPTAIDTSTRTATASTTLLGLPNDLLEPLVRPLAGGTTGYAFKAAECTIAIGFLTDAKLAATKDWVKTVATAESIRKSYIAMLESCTDPNDQAAAQLIREALQDMACDGFKNATVNVEALYLPELGSGTPEDFARFANTLIAWASNIQLTDADCDEVTPLRDTLEDLFEKYIDDKARRLDDLDATLWRRTWSTELLEAIGFQRGAALLELPQTATLIEERLLVRLFDKLRLAALAYCADELSQALLADLRAGGGQSGPPILKPPIPDAWRSFTLQELDRDIQHCANDVHITAFDDVPIRLDAQTRRLGQATPGQHDREAKVTIPSGGALQLAGQLRALRCESRTTTPRYSNDMIALHLDDTEVWRLSHSNGNYLATPLDLPLDELLEAADLPTDTTGTLTLTLRRQGEACNGAYGDGDTELYRIELTIEGASTIRWGPTAVIVTNGGRNTTNCPGTNFSWSEGQELFDVPLPGASTTATAAYDVAGTVLAPFTGSGTCAATVSNEAAATVTVTDEASVVQITGDASAANVITTSSTGDGFMAVDLESPGPSGTVVARFTVEGTVPFVLSYAGTAEAGHFENLSWIRLIAYPSTVIHDERRGDVDASFAGNVEGLLESGTYELTAMAVTGGWACSSPFCGAGTPPSRDTRATASFTLELHGVQLFEEVGATAARAP